MIQVSVITPVYNAAEFVTRAVESALQQPETAEVLLVEDGSPDNSLEICRGLAEKYEKVKLLRHPNGENRCAGASRNLGMQNASCEFIGFVDADDYYIPGRFVKAREIFEKTHDCEGVYESIGNHYKNEASLQRWLNSNRLANKLTGLTIAVDPGQLGRVLISGGYGGLHLDGLTLKSSVLEKSGYMSEDLRLHQDTDFIIRCALVARLYPGRLDEAVAMRGVHDHNRLIAPRTKMQEYKNRMAYWMCLYRWSKYHTSPDVQGMILNAILKYTRSHKYFKKFPDVHIPTRLVWGLRMLRLVGYPEVLLDLVKPRPAR